MNMRFFNIIAASFLMIFAISAQAQQSETAQFYGKEFETTKKATTVDQVNTMLETQDKVATQLSGEIKEVCQAKGCWMKVALENNEEVFVRFKDYGFFVPTDSAQKTTVMNGIVFFEEMSVEDQKHYAQDRGASPDEIAKITTPKKLLRFEADGVLIQD